MTNRVSELEATLTQIFTLRENSGEKMNKASGTNWMVSRNRTCITDGLEKEEEKG